MSAPTQDVLLTCETEAEGLWERARQAFERGPTGVVDLAEAVDLAVRTVEILMVRCLQGVDDPLPHSVTSLLESPPPDVDPRRDFGRPPHTLQFPDVVDMLSAEHLECVSPELHHGWTDHSALCRKGREIAQKAAGISLDERDRDDLVLIGAYRNRIFRLPPPTTVVPEDIVSAFPTLEKVVRKLLRV